jgi:primosomal protein N'
MYYQILPDRKVPQIYLTYSYDSDLVMGQVVEIAIRNSIAFGVVIQKLETKDIHFDLEKIKGVQSILPFIISSPQINFIFLMSQNTFNSINLIADSSLQFLSLLGVKELQIYKQKYSLADKNMVKQNIEKTIPNNPTFYVELDEISTTVRIRYIIRINIGLFPIRSVIVVVFPEKKLLEKEYQKMTQIQDDTPPFILLKFTGEKLKHSKETLRHILENNEEDIVIFTTRAGIFLPYSQIDQIVLIDESSSFHIQDQNQIYYDTRDCVFFLSQAYKCRLAFVSHTPSVRLSQFYTVK